MSSARKLTTGILIFYLNINIYVKCETNSYIYVNTSRNFQENKNELFSKSIQKAPRFLSFNAIDDDLKIDLEFAVPFIKIPVKRSMETANNAFKGLVNLNTASLALSGLLIVLGAGVGAFFTSFSKTPHFGSSGFIKKSRMESIIDPMKFTYHKSNGEKVSTQFGDFMESIEATFRENNIDITACIQKSICKYVQTSSLNVKRGYGTSTNKIVDGVISSSWILNLIEGTAIRDAVDTGTNGKSCSYKYQNCKWSESQTLEVLTTYFNFY